MNPYVWLLLLACTGSAITAGLILARDPASRSNRTAAFLSVCTAFWAMCEVAWNTSSDPRVVLTLVKLSAFGWIWIGPTALRVFLAASEDRSRRGARLVATGYALTGGLLILEWTTPWLHSGVVRTSWGWAYEFGPLYLPFYAITMASVGYGLFIGIRYVVRTASPAERTQGRWVLLALSVPLVAGSLTDGILPFLGIQLPRLGTLSLTSLCVTIAWSLHRYGYSLLVPGRFAPEILDVLSDGVVLLRAGGEIRVANRAAGELAGRSPEELVGWRLDRLLPFVPLDPIPRIEHLEGELVASGRRIPVSVASSSLADRSGSLLGVVLVVRDMREVAVLRQRLVISGRLAAVGELAAGIAHEINNPIAYVRSNLGVLRQQWQALGETLFKAEGVAAEAAELFPDTEELIEESLAGIDRVARIVRDVKNVSHMGASEREPADVNRLLERVLRVSAPQLEGRTRVETHLGELSPVSCSPQELEQVFLNLVLNAHQAMPTGGRIRIATAMEGSDAVVVVEDEGPGIPPEDQARIFDPFFTTKPQGEGTGLGLSISYQIVRQHGGEIIVASLPPHGTAFTVRLPASSP
ncbi:MAG: ATP-binding protein [Myxococcota bacterium]